MTGVDSGADGVTTLPLFPLQAVLFPDGVLPLRIFEVRYLDLIGRCHKEGAPFGVVALAQGQEVRQPRRGADGAAEDGFAPEALHTVGTLAHITHFERPQPGLMMVRCRGGRRFRLRSSEQLKHGLWVGQVEWLPDDPAVAVPPDLAPVRQGLERLLQHMQAQMGESVDGAELPIQPPYRWDESGWLANRWCELLPVSAQIKQQFLALDNPLLRLELVGDLLERLEIGGA